MEQKSLTVFESRTRFEGSNICSWIGFKHVMYLVEEAILEHFRESGYAPSRLYEDHGLCLEIVSSSVRILHALHMDDVVTVEVAPSNKKKNGAELHYEITLFVTRDGERKKALTGKVQVLFRRDTNEITMGGEAPFGLSAHTVNRLERSKAGEPVREYGVERGTSGVDEAISTIVKDGDNAFVWKWHIPYFYCHFTDRIQHSGYLRIMEEVVDLFLADRGISIRTMLDTRKWIPVVPSASVEILAEAYMEETIYTVYSVETIFKDTTYTAKMDCYVERDGRLVHTATGRITHGYAVIEDRHNWSLVEFDPETVAALGNAR